MNKLKQNKGITLIALVITIIVMLILAGVTINMAVNGGLFGYAGNAASQTKEAIEQEKALGNVEPNLTTEELITKFTEKELIHFSIGSQEELTAEKGMTISQWITSSYNTTTVCIEDGIIKPRPGYTESGYWPYGLNCIIEDGRLYMFRK